MADLSHKIYLTKRTAYLQFEKKTTLNLFLCLVLTQQGRQKLARFNAREFATLVIDILSDARRRQQSSQPSVLSSVAVKSRGKNLILA